jgi:hypothetical protein
MITQKPNPLLIEIEEFLAETGMGISYFGKVSANDSNLVQRLRNGVTAKGREVYVRPSTAKSVRSFMRLERKRRTSQEKTTA